MLQSVQKSTGKAKKSENKKVANSLVSRRMRASKPASKRRGRDSEGRRPRSRSKGQMRASSRTSSRNRQMAKMELGMLYDRVNSLTVEIDDDAAHAPKTYATDCDTDRSHTPEGGERYSFNIIYVYTHAHTHTHTHTHTRIHTYTLV